MINHRSVVADDDDDLDDRWWTNWALGWLLVDAQKRCLWKYSVAQHVVDCSPLLPRYLLQVSVSPILARFRRDDDVVAVGDVDDDDAGLDAVVALAPDDAADPDAAMMFVQSRNVLNRQQYHRNDGNADRWNGRRKDDDGVSPMEVVHPQRNG